MLALMPWGKSDDTTTFHPRVLALGSIKDSRQINEAWGFVHRAFCWSAQTYSDGFIPEHLVTSIATDRGPTLVKIAQRANLLGPKTRDPNTGMAGWYLLLDLDELLHLRTKAEVQAERDYRAQLRDPDIFGPVRLRDGDQCRYCGRVVKWKDGKTDRGGCLDHVINRDDTEFVVACRRCNGLKSDKTLDQAGLELQPAPTNPYYSDHTRKLLEGLGYTVPENVLVNAATRPQARGASEGQTDDAAASAHPVDDQTDDAAHGAHSVDKTDDAAASAHSVDGAATGAPQPRARDGDPPDQDRTKTRSADRGLPDQVRPGRGGTGGAGSVRDGPGRPRGARGRRKSADQEPQP